MVVDGWKTPTFFKLKYSWQAILYYFQVYDTLIWHLYCLLCDHHNKSNNHVAIQSWDNIDISPMLYVTLDFKNFLITGGLYLIPFYLFYLTLLPLPSGNNQFVPMNLSGLFVCLFFTFTLFLSLPSCKIASPFIAMWLPWYPVEWQHISASLSWACPCDILTRGLYADMIHNCSSGRFNIRHEKSMVPEWEGTCHRDAASRWATAHFQLRSYSWLM